MLSRFAVEKSQWAGRLSRFAVEKSQWAGRLSRFAVEKSQREGRLSSFTMRKGGGGRILLPPQLETAAPSRVNFREFADRGYLPQKHKKRAHVGTLCQ